jgi:hypothetical protein
MIPSDAKTLPTPAWAGANVGSRSRACRKKSSALAIESASGRAQKQSPFR